MEMGRILSLSSSISGLSLNLMRISSMVVISAFERSIQASESVTCSKSDSPFGLRVFLTNPLTAESTPRMLMMGPEYLINVGEVSLQNSGEI